MRDRLSLQGMLVDMGGKGLQHFCCCFIREYFVVDLG